MSLIEKIMGVVTEFGDLRIMAANGRQSPGEISDATAELREMIAAALDEARREGAEQMQAAAFDACVMQENADRRFAKSERNACAADCAADLTELIRALPLPTGPRKAVRLTDAEVIREICLIGLRVQKPDGANQLCRAIETAVLAANGLGGAAMSDDLMSLNDALGKMRDSVRAGDRAEMGPTLLSGLVAHIDAQREEIDRMRTALESIARHLSSEWPARCVENVRTARKALGDCND